MRVLFLKIGMFLWLLSAAPLLFAHDPGLSVATAHLVQGNLNIHLGMARSDAEILVLVDANHDGKIFHEELAAARPKLEKMALGAFEIKQDGQILRPAKAIAQTDDTGGLQFEVNYTNVTGGELLIRSTILGELARGHRQFLSVRGNDNKPLGEGMLDVSHDSYALTLAKTELPAVAQHSFRDFFVLGVEHIATGYDHILFLLGLLMVGGSFKSALKIITSFTIAHSITLALATMNIVNISPRVIEPLIAASIIYVGVENLFRRDMHKRWLLTFGFGLIHGCGFASALRELGIGSNGTSIVVPLVSFNLGVETGQMVLAAIVLPIVWKLRERPEFVRRFVPVGSCLIALAGTWWLLERTVF